MRRLALSTPLRPRQRPPAARLTGRALLRGAIAILLIGAPAAAQSLRIESAVPVTLRAGPGGSYPVVGELFPGEQAERGPCDEVGRWCVVSTDRTWGWLDTGVAAAAPRPLAPPAERQFGDRGAGVRRLPPGLARRFGEDGAGTRAMPPGLARGLVPPPAVTVTPLPPQGGRGRPLPSEIITAVPRAPIAVPVAPPAPVVVPGARPPLLLSTTVPIRNVTDGYVNLRAGPGTHSAIVGRLAPGEGGRIDLCDAPERWCRIAPEGQPQGWVLMRLVGLRRL